MISEIKRLLTENLPVLIPTASGLLGLGTGLLLTMPMFNVLLKKYKEAIDELTRFIRLHKAYFKSPPVQTDFYRVVSLWDAATEYTALVCKRIRFKKLSQFFKNIIKENWYK